MALAPLTFTLDIEDHRPDDRWPERYPTMARRVLEFVAEREVRATAFIVGECAEAHPDLVAEVAAAGHEVALHAWQHVPLTESTPERFRSETLRGKATIEDITGVAVVGFRAPTASLVPASSWAVDVLGELGFGYSSSVIPAHSPLFGWPGAPHGPFRWPNGLVEIPIPVAGISSIGLPHLSGVYFRVLPWPLVRLARLGLERTAMPNMYCHPYDFDPDEPRWEVPDVPRWGVPLLWWNRGRMFTKLDRLLASGPVGPPLAERLSEVPDGAPMFGAERVAA